MRFLSVRQPWATLIMIGLKDVENRGYRTPYRGDVMIHAAGQWDDAWAQKCPPKIAGEDAAAFYRAQTPVRLTVDHFPVGCVLGKVTLVDIAEKSDSQWWLSGKYAWIIKEPACIEPLPCRGQIGLVTPCDAVRHEVATRLRDSKPDWSADNLSRPPRLPVGRSRPFHVTWKS